MRKKVMFLVISVIAACLFFGSGVYVGAASKNGAGSQNDPVVSLSYLEYRLGQLEDSLGKSGSKSNQAGGTGYVSDFEKVTLERGERIIPGEGGVLVLYSGACTVVGKGINTTDAKALNESETVPAYSQILIVDASSGIVASEKSVIFLSKGK